MATHAADSPLKETAMDAATRREAGKHSTTSKKPFELKPPPDTSSAISIKDMPSDY